MDADVAIVGGGPTGLALANLLGAQGVRTLLIERSRADEAVQFPRAVGLDHDALRTFQGIGLVDEMLPDIIQNTAVRFFAADRSELVHLRRGGPQSAENGWYRRNMFMQHLTDAVLKRGIDRFECVEELHESEVVGLEQDDDGVILTVRGTGTELTRALRARYAVGADGARSTVRKLVGLKLEGDTYEEPWLILEVDGDPWDAPYSSFLCDPARPIYSGQLPRDHRRWGLMLLPGERDEDVLSDDGLRRLLSPLVPSFDDLNIISARVYRHQARLVGRMLQGRVALVGDAAHLMPPWAGQGLNSGLRDVTNLAWKLTSVLRGCRSTLLDSYDAERRPHAEKVIAVSRRFGKVFIPRARRHVAVRDVLLRTIRRIPVLREWFYCKWFTTPMRYEGGPAVVVRLNGEQRPAVGGMFIQPEVTGSDGLQRMDDVLGTWFAVVAFRSDPTAALSDESLASWKALGARFVRVEQSGSGALGTAKPGTCFEDTFGTCEQWFVRNRSTFAVIRPDRCVAAVGTSAEFEVVTRELSALLGLDHQR